MQRDAVERVLEERNKQFVSFICDSKAASAWSGNGAFCIFADSASS